MLHRNQDLHESRLAVLEGLVRMAEHAGLIELSSNTVDGSMEVQVKEHRENARALERSRSRIQLRLGSRKACDAFGVRDRDTRASTRRTCPQWSCRRHASRKTRSASVLCISQP